MHTIDPTLVRTESLLTNLDSESALDTSSEIEILDIGNPFDSVRADVDGDSALDVPVREENPSRLNSVESAANATVVATWSGSGDSLNYGDASNWDIGEVPLNSTIDSFGVIIPDGILVEYGLGGEIAELSLGNNSQLNLAANTSLTVLGPTSIAGAISSAGDFIATGVGVEFADPSVQLSATDGAIVEIAAPSYSSTGFSSATILSADGANSLLNLATVTTLDANFDDNSSPVSTQTISASAGGSIDLSGTTALTKPERGEDQIRFLVEGENSQIDLSALDTIDGGGDAVFELTDGEVIFSPLGQLQAVTFDVSGGARVTNDEPGAVGATYSTIGLGSSATVLDSTGTGSELDLSSIAAIDTSFDDNSSPVSTQIISARAGGSIDLSGVTELIAPTRREDRIQFLVEVGSAINLESLETIGGEGQAVFDLGSGTATALSSIQLLDDASFTLAEGATVTYSNAVEEFIDTTFSLSEGARVSVNDDERFGAIYRSQGLAGIATILSATGAGSELDLSSITTLDANFDDNSSPVSTQTISASAGGSIDLSGTTALTKPERGEDQIRFLAEGENSQIDLGSLRIVNGQGQALFELGGGTLQLGILPAGTTLVGNGTISTTTFTNDGGTLGPGNATDSVLTSEETGSILLTGNYIQSEEGRLNIQLGGTQSDRFDRFLVEGSATLGGTLDISLVDGFFPVLGDRFEVLEFGSRSGRFDTVNLPSLEDDDLAFDIEFSSRSLILEVVNISQTLFARNDGPFSTDADTPLIISVEALLENDVRGDGDVLTLTDVSNAINGTATLSGDNILFTPNPGFSGDAIFDYAVSGNNDTDTASVIIAVGDSNAAPLAVDDTFFTEEGVAFEGNILVNDSDPDSDILTASLLSDVSNGTLTLNADGTFNYAPAAGFSGVDTFTYAVDDGNGGNDTASVNVVSIPAALAIEGTDGNDTLASADPIAELSEFFDAGAGNDTINAGSGNDFIIASSGNNTVDAGLGDDTIFGNGQPDQETVINGGEGFDTVIYDDVQIIFNISFLDDGSVRVGSGTDPSTGDILTGVESLQFADSNVLLSDSFTLDVDKNGEITALEDGLNVLRVLLGAPVQSLVLGANTDRDRGEAETAIQDARDTGILDFDQNGAVTAVEDGLNVLRALLGAPVQSLVLGADTPPNILLQDVADAIDALR